MINLSFKPRMSFWQIINMNVGFFGIQYSFGLQQNAINPLYTFLHAEPENLPLLNLAGPITGLLIQPIIGAMSDRTWHPRWGRRKPYFLLGALFCSLCLFAFPFSSALWMAVGLLWILDAANNTAMEPYRAFVADRLPPEQQALGFLSQSFFTGFGITLAAVSLWVFKQVITGKTAAGIPYWVFGSFFVGAVCSIASVLWSVLKTPELPPSEEELVRLRSERRSGWQVFADIIQAIRHMPAVMWKLALVYLFQWYAMMCYWQFISHSIAGSVWHIRADDNPALYEDAVAWTGLINGGYNIVTFLTAFALVKQARKWGASNIHAITLMLAALSLSLLPFIGNKYLLFLPMIGLGIAWASMMGVPYIIVASGIPPARYGVYMGIVNMMIVIPMILQNLSFGFLYQHVLGSEPGNAILFAAALLLLAAMATLRIKTAPQTT
jgi:maltose/moltooligosaccharide transporter